MFGIDTDGLTHPEDDNIWPWRETAASDLLAACKLAYEQSHAMSDEARNALKADIDKAEGRQP